MNELDKCFAVILLQHDNVTFYHRVVELFIIKYPLINEIKMAFQLYLPFLCTSVVQQFSLF